MFLFCLFPVYPTPCEKPCDAAIYNFEEIRPHLCKVRKIFATLAKIRKEMRVERDIAGIALPFAIGVATFTYVVDILKDSPYATAAASSCITLTLLNILIYIRKHGTGSTLAWVSAMAALLACGLMCASTSDVLSASAGPGWLASLAEGLGEKMKDSIESIPFRDDRTGQIVKALLTGDRTGMDGDVVQAFRNSGASHILALSGLHLGIIYGMIRLLTRGFGNLRYLQIVRSAILISICGFYTLATGAGASIVRAFIFIVIGECIRLSGRQSTLKRTLMTALVIHLAISPSSIKEIGFQLSYAAIAGIAFIYPWLQGFWPGDRHDDAKLTKCARWIWDSAAMSISCQLTTAPLAYMYFRTFPTQFILTNLIALPLTGLIMPISLATLAAGMAGWQPQLLIDATEWMISLLYESLYLLSTM